MNTEQKKLAFATAGWATRVLSFGAASLIFSMWFLVPNDPGATSLANFWAKLRPITLFALALFLLVLSARWCFAKRTSSVLGRRARQAHSLSQHARPKRGLDTRKPVD